MEEMPLGVSIALGLSQLAAGLLIAWIAVRGWRGKLRRNRALGIRTTATLSSDEAWLRGHRAAGPWMTAAALGSIVPGIIVLFRPENTAGMLVIMVGLAVMVTLVMVGGFVGHSAAVEFRDDSG